jgi:hypothetical protein
LNSCRTNPVAMHSARLKENAAHDWSLEKSSSSHSLDLLDAFRLACYDLIVSSGPVKEAMA